MTKLWITLNAADLVLTYSILSKGGIEVNPIMAKLFEQGFAIGAMFKGLLVVLTIYLFRKRKFIMGGLCVGMGIVVLFNTWSAGMSYG